MMSTIQRLATPLRNEEGQDDGVHKDSSRVAYVIDFHEMASWFLERCDTISMHMTKLTLIKKKKMAVTPHVGGQDGDQ